VLLGSELEDLAAGLTDGGLRVLFFFHVQFALEGDGFLDGRTHLVLDRFGPAVERLTVQEDRPRQVEVVRRGVELVEVMDAVGDGVEERVLLGIQRARLDRLDRLAQVHDLRHRTEQLERAGLDLARQHADRQPLHVGGQPHRAHLVGYMAKAVLEPAENAIPHPRLDPIGQHVSELPVHRGARGRGVGEQERQVGDAQR
jgi:hypothetical protein